MSALTLLALLAVAPPDDARVEVLVLDERATRIANVELHVGAAVAVTDASGHATVVVPAGDAAMTLNLAGAQTAAGHLALQAGAVVDVVLLVDATHTRLVSADADVGGSVVDAAPTSLEERSGRLRVHVVEADDGAPLGGAQVFLRGSGLLGATDEAGVLDVTAPIGAHAVSVLLPGFAARVAQVTVDADVPGDVRVELVALSSELDDLTVRAPFLQGGLSSSAAERRTQKQVVEVVGAEQMSRAGDGDAAAALRRVTGLTVVGGRYAFVRGLGDRYSSTLVNGAAPPSPEPERRVIPLDLFPTTTLDSVLVQKSWSPELPGEFGGGSVQLRTRAVPEQRILSLGVSTGLVIGSTFGEGRGARGGLLDVVGVDDGTRALPAEVRAASDEQPLAEGNALLGGGLTSTELEHLGEQMGRTQTPTAMWVPPNLGLSATWGDRFATAIGDVGVIAAGSWSQDWLRTHTQRDTLTSGSDGLVTTQSLDVDATERSVTGGGVLGLAWQPVVGQRLRAVTLLNQSADHEARVAQGRSDEVGTEIRLTRLRWVQRTLATQQLLGEHALAWSPFVVDATKEPAQLTWRGGYALALRGEPDNRVIRQDLIDGVWLLSDRTDGNQRLFSDLVDHAGDAEVGLQLPFHVFDGLSSSLRVGLAANGKVREVDTRRFTFRAKGPRASDVDTRALPPEQAFSPANIDKDGFQIAEATRNTDNYTGAAVVGGSYARVDLALLEELDVSVGARVEGAHTNVSTFELFNAAAAPVVAELNTVDVLPSAAVTWRVLDELQLRLAASRTVVRPELRELSPAVFTDVAGGRARFGNPALVETTLSHVDGRLEWALSPREGVSLGVFGKHFAAPIEAVVTAGADQAVTWANADAAWLGGVELEGRVEVPAFASLPGDALRGFAIAGNVTLAASRVELGAEQQGTLTSTERPLQGQSPWVANAQLTWDREDLGSSVGVLYNVFGPRIAEVGALGLPDTIEEPFHQLDVVARQRLPWDLALSLKLTNVLDLAARRTIGGVVVEDVTRGRAVSLGLSWSPSDER